MLLILKVFYFVKNYKILEFMFAKITELIRSLFKPSIKPECQAIIAKLEKHGWHGIVICDEGKITYAGLYGKNNRIANAIKTSMLEHPEIRDAVIRAVGDFLCEKHQEMHMKSELEDLGIGTNE